MASPHDEERTRVEQFRILERDADTALRQELVSGREAITKRTRNVTSARPRATGVTLQIWVESNCHVVDLLTV